MRLIKTKKIEIVTILYVWLIFCFTPQQILGQQNSNKPVLQKIFNELGNNINSLKENNDYLKAELFAIFSRKRDGDFLQTNIAMESIATNSENQRIFFDYLYDKFEPRIENNKEFTRYSMLLDVLENKFLILVKDADLLARYIDTLGYLTESEKKIKFDKENIQNTRKKEWNQTNNEDSLQIDKMEAVAEFPGGQISWYRYLRKNLKSNIPYDNKAPKGKYSVILNFIVKKDGTISDIMAETNFGYGMENEAIRIMANSPKWIPALKTGGIAVSSYHLLRIVFEVEEGN